MMCQCGCEQEARRKWATEACRQKCRTDASAVANRKGKRLDGTLRPSKKTHNRGRRSDGTRRPSREIHDTAHNASRPERKGQHTTLERLERPFHAIDGEGANVNDGHEYLLLGSGKKMITTGEHLDFRTCMAFLAGTIPDGVEPIVFGLGYDVTQWIRFLPREALESLMDRQSRASSKDPWKVKPVSVQGYEIDWLPNHWFRFRTISGRIIEISEVQKFFGHSFIEALEAMGIEFPAWLQDMKDKRSSFTKREVLGPEVAFYNSEERRLLEILMTRYREKCIESGITPRRWQGPGHGASVLLNAWGIKDHLSRIGERTR